jgi:hypothetical protein
MLCTADPPPARCHCRRFCTRAHTGPGAQCEGENSPKISGSSTIDVATVHLYERHMELRPPLWQPCDFACLMAWMPPYLDAHEGVARAMSKPLLIEETGAWAPA